MHWEAAVRRAGRLRYERQTRQCFHLGLGTSLCVFSFENLGTEAVAGSLVSRGILGFHLFFFFCHRRLVLPLSPPPICSFSWSPTAFLLQSHRYELIPAPFLLPTAPPSPRPPWPPPSVPAIPRRPVRPRPRPRKDDLGAARDTAPERLQQEKPWASILHLCPIGGRPQVAQPVVLH